MEASEQQLAVAGLRYINALTAETNAIRAVTHALEEHAMGRSRDDGVKLQQAVDEAEQMYRLATLERKAALEAWQQLGGSRLEE